MRFENHQSFSGRRAVVLSFGLALMAISLLIVGASSAQQPDSRPRQTGSASATPSPQPTATPVEQTGPGRRIAPQLGAPPPAPILKPKPTPPPDPNSAEIDENSKIIVNTELVTLHVRVIDRNNHPINNISKNDFKVLEDNVPQPIFSFTEEEVPVIYGLAVDTSGSLRPQFEQVINASKTIINSNKKGPDDDRRRRALIVVTDGEDRASYYPEAQLFSRLREEDVQIYVIGFVNELDADKGLIRKSPRDKAVNLINRLASETGGRAFFPQSIAELPQIANEIVRDLRTQYVISYDPTNKAHDGSYRAIKVTVNQPTTGDRRIALTRPGRTATAGATAAKPATKSPSPVNTNTPRWP